MRLWRFVEEVMRSRPIACTPCACAGRFMAFSNSLLGGSPLLLVLPHLGTSVPEEALGPKLTVKPRIGTCRLFRAATTVPVLVFLAPDESILLRVKTTAILARHDPWNLQWSESRGERTPLLTVSLPESKFKTCFSVPARVVHRQTPSGAESTARVRLGGNGLRLPPSTGRTPPP